jgi:DNA repair protein RecO
MYHIYQTQGLILKSSNIGEANKFFYILTPDLGLIRATAQGVRHLKSKLRHSLQDFSLSNISLVHGKGGWRLINASLNSNLHQDLLLEKFKVVAKVLTLLNSLIQGEEGNEKLFHLVVESVDDLDKKDIKDEDLKNWECSLVAQVLDSLGYFTWQSGFQVTNSNRKLITNQINTALKETHLIK